MPHLVLVLPDEREKTQRDFRLIADVARSNGVYPHIVQAERSRQLHLLPLWLRPALSVSMANRRRRNLLPGTFLTGRFIGKVAECAALDAAGVSAPKWQEITPSTRLDPQEWGPYVIEKPAHGWWGAFVRIRRTERVKYTDPNSLPADHPGRNGPMIVQSFVYTGEWPISYRVVTVFGEPILSIRQTTRRGSPVKHRWDFKGGGAAIVSNTMDMKVDLSFDQEIIDFACMAHRAAFPDIPMLQFDIGRDIETGQLFVFESHPWHPAWPFSSDPAIGVQAEHNLHLESQFDAMERIGRVLARETFARASRRHLFRD